MPSPPDADGGGPDRTSRLFLLVYDELRRVAANCFHGQRPDHTLQPTALVHEVYERLRKQDNVTWNGRRPFVALAATMMEQILINHAKKRAAKKRPSSRHRVPLDQATHLLHRSSLDALAVHESLGKVLRGLSAESPRAAKVVHLRFLKGLSIEETAERLGVSVSTVKGDWRYARAFLSHRLGSEGRP